jgi:hypothetical protein
MSLVADLAAGATGGPLGLIFGGVSRMVPEVLKFMDRKGDRAHEVTMFDKQLEADKQKSADQLAIIQAQHATEADTKELDAIVAALQGQGARSGVAWVDALNTMVRPVLTLYWCIGLYTAVLTARFILLLHAKTPAAEAILSLWGPNERDLVAAMVAFWFVDRALRNGGGVSAPH